MQGETYRLALRKYSPMHPQGDAVKVNFFVPNGLINQTLERFFCLCRTGNWYELSDYICLHWNIRDIERNTKNSDTINFIVISSGECWYSDIILTLRLAAEVMFTASALKQKPTGKFFPVSTQSMRGRTININH